MIDNFEKIGNIIRGKSGIGEFYFLQILRRRKDNPDQDRDMIVVDTFFIDNEADLLKQKARIIEICTINNARAYFRLNKRDKKKVALQTLRLISASIAAQQYEVRNAYHSACGQFSSDKEKKWVIDVDTRDRKVLSEIILVIHACRPLDSDKKVIDLLSTPNGFHLITKPFDVQQFRKAYNKAIDIHKDNPTILYMP